MADPQRNWSGFKSQKETKTTLCRLIVLYHEKKNILIFLTEESSNDITNSLNYDTFPQFTGLYYKESHLHKPYCRKVQTIRMSQDKLSKQNQKSEIHFNVLIIININYCFIFVPFGAFEMEFSFTRQEINSFKL